MLNRAQMHVTPPPLKHLMIKEMRKEKKDEKKKTPGYLKWRAKNAFRVLDMRLIDIPIAL